MKKSTVIDNKENNFKKTKSQLAEELTASEIRYRSLFESTKDGILILDAETGKIVDVNPFLIDLLSYSKSEFIEKSIWEIGAFQDIYENKEKFLELQKEEYVRYDDLPLVTSDGREIHVEFISSVYIVNNNKVVQCNIRDNTARKEAQVVLENTRTELAEIKESTDEINELAENVIDTIREPLLALSEDLRVIKASRSFYKFFKVTAEETIGKLIYELGNHQWDIPKLKELLEEIIPEKNPFDNYEVEHNFSTIGKRVMLLNARQVKRAFGKEKVILLAIEDITQRKGKEDSLKETQRETSASLNIILDHMHAPIILWDTSMIIKRFNRKFELLSGYDSTEVIGKKIDILFPKEKRATTLELLKNHPDDEQDVIEIDILTKDNRIKTVLWISSRILDDEGKNIIATISQDITDRRESELALRKSESHLRTLVNTIPDLIWLKDSNGVYLSCNPMFERFFGAAEADIIGKTDYDFVDRELAGFFRENDQKAIKAGKPTSNEEWVTFADDGHRAFLDTIKSPIYDSDGTVLGILGIGRDITERMLAEQKIQDSEKRFRAIFDQAPIAVALIDLQGYPILSNLRLSEMLGYTKDELSKMMFTEFTYQEDIDKDLNQFTDLIAGKISGYSMKKRYIHKNGNLVWANLFVTTLNDSNGLPQEIISMIEDITERKKAEDALLESEIKYRAFFENSMDAILLTSPDGKILSANQASLNMFGYTEDELIKMGRSAVVDESDSRLDDLLEERSLKGRAQGEVTFLRKDRTPFPVEISSAIFKNQKGFELTSMIIRDITLRKQAEKEIAMLAHSLKSINECVSITDLEDKILFVNESFLKTYGYERNELIGENISMVRSQSNERSQFDEILPATIQGEWHGELMNRKKDGTEFPVYLSTTLIKVKENKVLGLIGVASDITERKKIQNEIKFQADLINNVGQAVIATDLVGKVIYWNNAAEKIYGWSNSEAIGQNIMDLTPARHTNDQAIDIMKKLGEGKTWAGEFYVKRKDGSSFPAFVTDTPILDSNGKLTGIIGISSDITERKRGEIELMKLSRAVEQSPASVIVTDLKGSIEYVNPKTLEITGYTKEELIGKNPRLFSTGEKLKEDYQQLWATLLSGKEWFGEFHNKKKNGELYWESASISPILSENHEIINYVAIKEDITERKKIIEELKFAKEKAEESDRLKTAFLHNISHEVRTPMNAIVGFSGFLNTPDLMPDELKHYTDIIIQSSEQLLAIIDDIISIASIEAGQEKIKENETNINLICKLVYEQFSSKAKDKNVTLGMKTVLNDDEAIIITDSTKLTQILTNLTGNAIKFTRQGHVNFGYTVKDNQLEFYVEDSGIGIHLDMQKVIFNRFRQVETTDARNFGGSGLGLSISKAYAEMLGGNMWLSSELGKGSVFYFNIPYKNTIVKKLPEIQSVKKSDFRFGPNITLLIAEDENSNFMLMEVLLKDTGINIIRAMNGKEAVEFCKNNPHIDLVMMDLKMPKMDGYEASKLIKEFRPDLPIIALTAYSTEVDRDKALASGCSEFISKPFKRELFLAKINEHLHK
ncbi:MAG: PAS domain S-box protein [Bacteroidales bacterium]|nr:PAS domain S-box protein [Bacteroidales bacterium]